MKTKTVLIYDQLFEKPISFRVVEGDYAHLNGSYINHMDLELSLSDELLSLLFKDDEGNMFDDFTDTFPVDAMNSGAKVIVVGFLP